MAVPKYAYCISRNGWALEVLDVSNPNAPVHAATLANGAGGAYLEKPSKIAVRGNYCYCTVSGDTNPAGFEVVDISDPLNPTHAGVIYDNATGVKIAIPNWTVFKDNYAFVTSSDDKGVQVFDITNPASPSAAGSIYEATYMNGAAGMAIEGDLLYVVSGNSTYSLTILDISDPPNISHVGRISDGGALLLDQPRDVHVRDHIAYCSVAVDDCITVIDCNNPASPSALSNTQGTGDMENPSASLLDGKYLYVTARTGEALNIYDTSNPAALVLTDSITTGGAIQLGNAFALTKFADVIYVALFSDDGVQLLDVSNPYAIRGLGSIYDGAGGADLDNVASIVVPYKQRVHLQF